MTYCFSCSCSCFSSFSYFISNSCFMNTAIHFAFPILFMFHVCCIWNLLYLYGMILMYSHIIHVFLSLYESILLRNWNHSNWIIQTKVTAFSCQTSQFIDFSLGTVCKQSFFSGAINWLEHSPTLSEFLGHIESEFEGTYFRMFG